MSLEAGECGQKQVDAFFWMKSPQVQGERSIGRDAVPVAESPRWREAVEVCRVDSIGLD